jgi:hypothetical protein
MPIREPQIVGISTFKTKKELHTYTEKLIEKKGICEIDNLDTDFLFFLSLYSRKPSHSDYVKNIQKFKITLDPIKKNKANHLSCIDNNNKEFIFSWRSCCDGRDTKISDKLKEACRTSIKEQTASCWANNSNCCNCGKNKTNGFEVDHYKKEFCKIYKDFMEINTIQIPDDFESDIITSQYMFKKEDNIFNQSFQNYHRENAILQLLCKDCHREKTNCFISKK